MNQILGTNLNINYQKKYNSNNSTKKFKVILFVALILIVFLFIFYFFSKSNAYKKEKISQSLASNFSIKNLYSTSNNYSAIKTSTSNTESFSEPFVIGLLKIDKINLMYPILSTVSDELLEISPCRFHGPMPNEVGNLCIAGHNYRNQKHFGKLSLLDSGDIINVYDLNSNKLDYIIYEKSEVSANDTSCMNQNTNGIREITLITCNTIKGTRIVIKAKENR